MVTCTPGPAVEQCLQKLLHHFAHSMSLRHSKAWVTYHLHCRWPLLQVLHAVKAHRKLKQAGIGQRLVHDVLCLDLEKDGSDTWRLEPVIELLKQGGVSSTLALPGLLLVAMVCICHSAQYC
jgi:hypothetical protein